MALAREGTQAEGEPPDRFERSETRLSEKNGVSGHDIQFNLTTGVYGVNEVISVKTDRDDHFSSVGHRLRFREPPAGTYQPAPLVFVWMRQM